MKSCALYVHIPFCKSKCAYCDFFSVVCNASIDDAYIHHLIEEAEARAAQFDISQWSTIYFGGGTPSLLAPNQIETLIGGLKAVRPAAKNAEITFECNPDDITVELLETLKKCGVNRLSVGLQAMNDETLTLVNRRAHRAENLRALKLLAEHWLEPQQIVPQNLEDDEKPEKFAQQELLPQKLVRGAQPHYDAPQNLPEAPCPKRRLSVDLICGLPGQKAQDFFAGLDEIISCGADHISLYSLTLEEDTPLYKAVDSGKVKLPEAEETDSWWIKARDTLEKSGFAQYEVSNFAKQGCRSRHNMTYWKMLPYIGIGAGATGTVGSMRYTNSRSIKDWLGGAGEEREMLPPEIQQFEYLMMAFRTVDGADAVEFEKRFGKSIDLIEPVFSSWCRRGLAEKTGSRYALNKQGLLLLNRFLEEIICFFE
ncbi:MAG: coproporphyrinogen III oxidase family protein [Spirochaetaceae bacterium]|nr:coproporphyrinogen III oxidase family protein [Spirochaetaceae bacterium]